MQAAFFHFRIFPPPASGTNIFPLFDGTCTGLAANTWKTFVV
jgi:hypothetical protein